MERRNDELHPIAEELAVAFGPPSGLSAETLERTQLALLALPTSEELRWALKSLVKVAATLDESRGATDASQAIIGVCENAVPTFMRLAAANQQGDGARESAEDFDEFAQREGPVKSAPRFGEAAPKGSIPIARLIKRTNLKG